MEQTEEEYILAELAENDGQTQKVRKKIEALGKLEAEPDAPDPAEPLRAKVRKQMALLTLGEATEADLATAQAALKRMEAENAKQQAARDSKRQNYELARAELQSRLDAIEPRSRELRDRLFYLQRAAIKAGEEDATHRYREALRAVGEAWAESVAHADLLMEVERVDRPNPVPIEQRLSFGTSLINSLGPMPILPGREAFAACKTPQCIVIPGERRTEQAGGPEIRVDRAAIVADVRKRFGF